MNPFFCAIPTPVTPQVIEKFIAILALLEDQQMFDPVIDFKNVGFVPSTITILKGNQLAAADLNGMWTHPPLWPHKPSHLGQGSFNLRACPKKDPPVPLLLNRRFCGWCYSVLPPSFRNLQISFFSALWTVHSDFFLLQGLVTHTVNMGYAEHLGIGLSARLKQKSKRRLLILYGQRMIMYNLILRINIKNYIS